MPFKSRAQARWMFSEHPAMARRWAGETESIKALPQHVKRASGGLAMYAAGGAVDDRTPLYTSNYVQRAPEMSLTQIEAMKPLAGLAGGGKPRTLVELMKSLPRSERFPALREHELSDISNENAMFATLKSDASPLAMYGPFPDHKLKGNMAFVPRSRRRFGLFDSSRPDETGHATELGSIAANWKGAWKPEDLIDIEIKKALRGQGYGRETVANLLSTVKDENQRFPLFDVKSSARKYWESMGAQMKDPSRPFRQHEKAVFDADGLRDLDRSVGRNNDYYLTPGDFLENVERFAGGGVVGAIGSDVDGGSGGDQRLDIRSRLLDTINKRIEQQSTTSGAQRASIDLTGPLRSARRLTLPHLADPWAAQYLARTPFDTQLGYGRYPTPEARREYAEGGKVEDESFVQRHPWLSLGGAGAAAAMRPRLVNAVTRPFARAMSKPVLGMEAVSHNPLSREASDRRYDIAREAAMHEYADRPVHHLQGAWQGERGMEYNPLYAQELPRSLGRIDRDDEALRYAAQMGENLEQQATPVSRFVPHAWNTEEGANALMVHGVDDQDLRSMAELLGPNVVTAHRPGRKAMVFPLDETRLHDIATDINARFSHPKMRFGRSDPGKDRVLLSRQPLGYEDATYAQKGATPRNETYSAFERAGLREWLMNDLARGAK